jgi:hypothetical protein
MIVTIENIKDMAEKFCIYSDKPVMDKRGKFRELTSDITYRLSNGMHLEIKAGFRWDEASVPWILQPLFPKSGIHSFAALPHDALYFLTKTTKEFADREYVFWMLAVGVSPSQVKWRWFAVRVFGWSWWKKNMKNPSENCKRNRNYIRIF